MLRRNFASDYNHSRTHITRNVAKIDDVNNFNEYRIENHNCGILNQCCPFCEALLFKIERNTRGVYVTCCNNGSIILPRMTKPTELMQDLFHGVSEKSKLFLKSPRYYNTQLSFASIMMK